MTIIYMLLIGFSISVLGMAFIFLSLRATQGDDLSRRLHDYVEETTFQPKRSEQTISARSTELAGTFSNRILLPGFRRVGRLLGRFTPTGSIEDLGKQLTIAGNPLGLGPREFYGIRLAFTLLGFWVAYTLLQNGINNNNIITSALTLMICSYLPKAWLKGRVRSRQNKIRRGMPDALDMLSVCADAGLGFDQSMQRVSEHWQTPLGIEFGRVISEMEMGLPRSAALRNMSDRLDIPELSSFVAVIIQSDQLGMSIADTLGAQAKQMREERHFRAQEQARKMPVKMLFPMILFIFPAMLIVILGPLIPAFRDFFESFTRNIQ